MPALPALALRGRARRFAAGVFTSAFVVCTIAPAAPAADRELTVSAAGQAVWQGRSALSTALFDPATLTPCGATQADVCDTTLLHVEGTGTLSLRLAQVDAGTPDVDLYVYRSDVSGLAGPLVAVSNGPGPGETVHLAGATGSYLVAGVSFAMGPAGFASGFAGTAALLPRATAVPDVDRPRGIREALVSDVGGGAASQPAVAVSPRDRDLLVAAYRAFADPDAYSSQIATAVSFDRGRSWQALGAVSAASGANPALAFDAGGDALLVTNEGSASLVARRWSRPSARDVRRDRTWEPPVTLSTPPAGAVDERPVLASARHGLMVCWVRTTDLGAYGRQAVLCRRSPDARATWEPASQPSPVTVPGLPYGPYVGGVAVAARRDAFTVAWVDTLGGTLSGSGLDSAWVARSSDGAVWRAPVRAASFRALPEHFARDRFRNVPLLTLAATRRELYLAFAAEVAGQADVQLVRSDDAGARWSEPATVGADASAADQFQPSLAVSGHRVHVSFLDRRLDAAGTFVDEWLATSVDSGRSWDEERLSHDSWDPAIGAPHSPTGDLLGDHQALVADRCGAVALAADPHLANSSRRDPDFDRGLRRSTVPQLFAWAVRDRRCE
jgi:hypothetical protein